MEFTILDKKRIENKQWILCKGNLLEYISTLKRDFSEFQIQRRIVKNGYLDTLLKTITENEPMPTITLMSTRDVHPQDGIVSMSPDDIEILDGLQRSFRLWVFWMLSDMVEKEGILEYKVLADKLKTPELEYIKRLDFVNASYLKSILDKVYRTKVLTAYKQYDLIFVVWVGLTDQEVVEKMLVLNAGQRAVTSTHQFEILFLHYFDKEKLQYNSRIRLLREKDADYFRMKHGNREIGEYALTSIIIAIQSYLQAKPLRIATVNKVMIEDDPAGDARNHQSFFTGESLSKFINLVFRFDCELYEKGIDYKIWYGKDTVLSGLYAAFGARMEEKERTVDSLEKLFDKLDLEKIDFDLDGYNKAYSEMSSVHVNVGQKVREAIFAYTKAMLKGDRISWSRAFNRNDSDYGYTTQPLF